MKRLLRPLKNLACRAPGLGELVEAADIWRHFRVERALIDQRHHTTNAHPSILHFTVNKAASQHVLEVLSRCGRSQGLTPVRLPSFAFATGFPYLARLSEAELKQYYYLFKPTGYVYTAFNDAIEGIPGFERYRTVLMLRDPRDALVSSYFSYGYSHQPPPRSGPHYANFVRGRQKVQAMTLDEFVRRHCETEARRYERYKSLLAKAGSSVYFTRFEDMTADYPRWLRGVLDHTGLNIPDALFRQLLRENERSQPVAENIHKHRRRGRPGEHREKLSEATIAAMNARMKNVLQTFGYDA